MFAKPSTLTFPEAASLLLVGTTAADLLHTSGAGAGETVLLHGAAGAVGMSVLQQARILGVRVVGTASPANFDVVRRFGGIPVEYGPGLLGRVRAAAPEGVAAALDTVGSDDAGDVSLALVEDRDRVVTIAAAPRAKADGYVFIGASNPASGPFRARVRRRILKLAQDGDLVVPMAETFKFDDAPAAFAALTGPHPSLNAGRRAGPVADEELTPAGLPRLRFRRTSVTGSDFHRAIRWSRQGGGSGHA